MHINFHGLFRATAIFVDQLRYILNIPLQNNSAIRKKKKKKNNSWTDLQLHSCVCGVRARERERTVFRQLLRKSNSSHAIMFSCELLPQETYGPSYLPNYWLNSFTNVFLQGGLRYQLLTISRYCVFSGWDDLFVSQNSRESSSSRFLGRMLDCAYATCS